MTRQRSRSTLAPTEISPVFIGGQRRSGTTLMRVLLNRHPHIACGPESKFVQHPSFAAWHERLATEWAERVERYGFGPEAVDRAVAAMVDHLFSTYACRAGKTRWAEKTPTNIIHIDYLFRLFPHAQFLHVIRDPRDTYCSIRQRAMTDKPHWARFTAKRSATDWRDSVLAGKQRRRDPQQYHEVTYESLVEDAPRVMRAVLHFLHEPWDDQIFDPTADNCEAQTANVQHAGFSRSSVGRWRRELDGRDIRKIESVAGELMVELGYELA